VKSQRSTWQIWSIRFSGMSACANIRLTLDSAIPSARASAA